MSGPAATPGLAFSRASHLSHKPPHRSAVSLHGPGSQGAFHVVSLKHG